MMSANESILSVFDKSVEIGLGWKSDDTRASGYRKCYFSENAGAKIKTTFKGCAISLLRGSIWQSLPIVDGVDYDLPNHPNPLRPVEAIDTEKYIIKIDERPSYIINLGSEHLEIPLAENLSLENHTLQIEATGPGQTTILGFRILKSDYGSIQGKVNSESPLYLNDIRVTLIKDGQFYDKRLARNPNTCDVLLWGLEPGNYDLTLEAIGWQPVVVNNLNVKANSITVFPDVNLVAEKIRRVAMPTKSKRTRFFRLVKFGHLDTWTQRNAEYLATLVQLTNLYDPDLLLISNEANWQYVSGALNKLNAPYMITSGNHGLPGFETYYGEKLKKIDIGDITIVVYNAPWLGPVPEIEAAFNSSPQSSFRILQGVESDIDQEWGKCLNLDIYLCAHAYEKSHAESAPWLHLGKEFQIIDIDLETYQTVVIKSPHTGNTSREKYPISREFPFEPIRFTPANNGEHTCVKAKVINPMLSDIKDNQLCFIMPKGKYSVSNGQIQKISDTTKDNKCKVEVRFDILASTTLDIEIKVI